MYAALQSQQSQRIWSRSPAWLSPVRSAVEVRPLVQFLVLLGIALLFRFPAFGEWNYAIDDQFYALVGQRLLDGDLLYVDIWDRKPPALYLTFSLIALMSRSTIAYQLVALLFAASGAYGVNRIARRFVSPLLAVLAGITYLALLNRFEGDNAQAGVFYNTWIIGAACLILSQIERLRQGRIGWKILAAFACIGIALSYKQSTVFEGAGLGLFVTYMLVQSGRGIFPAVARAALLATIAALPMLAVAAFYWNNGHVADLWAALVKSNMSRGYADPIIRVRSLLIMSGMLGIPLVFAGFGIVTFLKRLRLEGKPQADDLTLACVWLVATLAGLTAFPNVYVHYAQSALPPLAILSTGYFVDRRVIWPGLVALIGLSIALSGSFHLRDRWHARGASAQLVDYIRSETPNRDIFVWGNPNFLYAVIGTKPPSVLAFAPHMYEGREWTGRDSVAVMRGILAKRPSTVISQFPIQASPLNMANLAQVDSYVRSCRHVRKFTTYDHHGSQTQTVYSLCGRD